ncbi:MAG TPA: DUF4350 domain-containing protein [Cytophagaceae bacterium]|jgi:hypothetical protein|nr:DUF4350 domain-containing protein [Cytophagaceae bacterium]
MKNKKALVFLLIIAIVIAGGLIYYLFFNKEKTNWDQHYKEASKDPYGTFVLYGLLKHRAGGLKDINSDYLSFIKKEAGKDSNANIVLVNRYAFLSDTEATVLMDWTALGNTVFMATESIPGELMRKLYTDECGQEWQGLSTYSDSIIHPNFALLSQRDSVDYTYKAPYPGPDAFIKSRTKQWTYYDSRYLCDSSHATVQYGYLSTSKDSGYVNFIFIPYGKGGFYFHTNPLLFSNYYLLDYQHLRYTSKVFQHLSNGTIYFDKFHKSYQDFNQNSSHSEGPLVYILSQRSLKYGWYLLLAMTGLYIFFRAKRKQKPIAILEEKKNTTLEYYKTVGSLYFQQQDPYKISLLMFRMFRIYVKEKYKISIKTNDEYTVRLLSTRSKINQEHVERLLTMDRYVNTRPAVSKDDVVSYYQRLNYFYLNCK